mgnify:CR=1 FL=1
MIKYTLIAVIFVTSLISCSKKITSNQNNNSLQTAETLSKVVINYADIVHASYVDSLDLANNMKTKIQAFLESPTEKSFGEAKESWINSRFPYLQTEVYRFYGGPIDDEDGPEGLLNAWPMDEAYVDDGTDDTTDDTTTDDELILRFLGADSTLDPAAAGLANTDELRAMLLERARNLYT